MALTLYLLRHGQTESSRENVFCGSDSDPGLTDEGKEMAEEFAKAYKDLKWQAIYSSPARRAQETAKPLSDILSIEAKYENGLKEIGYGAWEGKSQSYVDEKYHDDYIKWNADPAWHAPTNGEPAIAIAHRSLKVIEEINKEYADGNVLIVSHKATLRIILCSLLGIDVGRFRSRFACPVASLTIVSFDKQGPLLMSLADRTHLSKRLRELPGT